MDNYFGDVWLIRILLQKGMAFIYAVAFLSAYNQFPALLGEQGLLPVRDYLKRVDFVTKPSLFHWYYSDRFFKGVAFCGIFLSLAMMFGVFELMPLVVSMVLWLLLWVLYLSIVNVGQTFYAFGWESMLLEAGFITAFLGNASIEPSLIPIMILRFMLLRTELGAGLIKVRHDQCWRDLTCLFYHYETQPLPNPLSFFFHRLPRFVHRFSVLFSHFVQLIVPFFLFAPQPIASIAGVLIIVHQLLLIVSGNFSWLNWLTVVLAFSALSDKCFSFLVGLTTNQSSSTPLWYDLVLYLFLAVVAILSWKPLLNLFSKDQLMNYSYNPFHLINTYGAFGSITKIRYEIIIEGTTDDVITDDTRWRAYEFKAKPGSVKRCPPIIAPYHLRLDWLMWFLPFGVNIMRRNFVAQPYDIWFMRFIEKLLRNDKMTTALLRTNPFATEPPNYIRARFFHYEYTSFREFLKTKAYWSREFVFDYLPPASLKQDI